MSLKPAICTQCGGQIQVDDSKDAGICPNCGTAFITEKVINQYVTQNNFAGATFNVQGGPNIENLYILARRAKDASNYEDAIKYYSKILEIEPENWEAIFYNEYFKACSVNVEGINKAIYDLEKSTFIAIDLLCKSEENSKELFIKDISERLVFLAVNFNNNASIVFNKSKQIRGADDEYRERKNSCINLLKNTAEKMRQLDPHIATIALLTIDKCLLENEWINKYDDAIIFSELKKLNPVYYTDWKNKKRRKKIIITIIVVGCILLQFCQIMCIVAQ